MKPQPVRAKALIAKTLMIKTLKGKTGEYSEDEIEAYSRLEIMKKDRFVSEMKSEKLSTVDWETWRFLNFSTC